MNRTMRKITGFVLVAMLIVAMLGAFGSNAEADDSVNLLRLPSVTYGEGSGILGGKDRIFDGDHTTHADLVNDGCYVDVDFGKQRTFDRWVVVLWDDFGSDWVAARFAMLASDDGENYTEISAWDNETDKLAVIDITLDNPVKAQYVRLQFTRGSSDILTIAADDQVRLREWEVYGDAEGETIPEPVVEEEGEIPAPDPELEPETRGNVAAGLDPSAYSRSDGDGHRKAFDGNYGTHCDLYGTVEGDDAGTCWLQVDLGEVRNIDRWTVHNFMLGESTDFVNANYALFTADSAEGPWVERDRVNNDYYKSYITDRMLPEAVDAQYVRIWFFPSEKSGVLTVNADNQVRVDEVELFGDNGIMAAVAEEEAADENAPAPDPELEPETRGNVAAGLAPEAYSRSDGDGHRKAFDGNYGTHCDLYGTVEGDDAGTCWLQVDLGEVRNIDRWTVHNFMLGESTDFVNANYALFTADSAEGPWVERDRVNNDYYKSYITDRMLPEAVDAQYVRIWFFPSEKSGVLTVNADNQVRVDEVELFGDNGIMAAVAEEEAADENAPAPDPELEPETRGNVAAGLAPEAYSRSDGDGHRKAFDGNYGTHCDLYGTVEGDDAGTCWLQVDLGEVRNIDRWTVHNFMLGESTDFVNANYALFTADSAEGPWVERDRVNNDYYKSYITDRMLPEAVDAQYVRIWFFPSEKSGVLTVSADNQVRVDEVELFGNNGIEAAAPAEADEATEAAEAAPAAEAAEETAYNRVKSEENLALTLGEYASYGKGDLNEPPYMAFDGDMGTGTVVAEDDTAWEHWLRLDLPEAITFNRTVIYPFIYEGGYLAFVVRNIDLQVSEDGETWTTVANLDNEACNTEIEKSFDTVTAQYIRLYFNRVDENGKKTDDWSCGPCIGDNFARVVEWQLYLDTDAE